MFRKGYLLSTPGAVLVLILFFLPWVELSCAGEVVATVSGYEAAAGMEGVPQLNIPDHDGSWWAWGGLVAVIAVAIGLFTQSSRVGLDRFTDGVLHIIGGLISFCSFFGVGVMLALIEERSDGMIKGDTTTAGDIFLMASIGVIVGGIWNIIAAGKEKRNANG
jgi:hypothetical protein